MAAVRSTFTRLAKDGRGAGRRELKDAFVEQGWAKLGDLVHSPEVGGSPTVDGGEFEMLSEWWRSMLKMEGVLPLILSSIPHTEILWS